MSISDWVRDPTTPNGAVQRLVSRRWGQVQRGEYEVCLALSRLQRDNVHRHKGRARFPDYAEQAFGIPAKLASLFCFIARQLERLPKTRIALECGDLTYTKAREFVKIATVEDEQGWIDYALSHTNRDLERRCKRERLGTNHDTKEVKSRLSPVQVQTVRKAREIVMKETGQSVSEDQMLPMLADRAVNFSDAAPLFGTTPPKVTPYLTINLCPQCTHTYVPIPGENLRVPVKDWFEALKAGAEVHDLLSDLLCDCKEVKHRRDRCPERDAPSPSEGPPKNRHVPADVWRRIEARDGHRCRVPGCGCPVPLEKSHLKPFRDGTPAMPEFIAQHCATCNDLIETGRLVVKGEAPLERYYCADGEFIGHGFDPSPHVGLFSAQAPEGDSDPPEASSDAA